MVAMASSQAKHTATGQIYSRVSIENIGTIRSLPAKNGTQRKFRNGENYNESLRPESFHRTISTIFSSNWVAA